MTPELLSKLSGDGLRKRLSPSRRAVWGWVAFGRGALVLRNKYLVISGGVNLSSTRQTEGRELLETGVLGNADPVSKELFKGSPLIEV